MFVVKKDLVIPVEVCEQIISFCWGKRPWLYDDHTTLWACARTCKDWFPRSRTLLYHYLIISNHEQLISLVKSLNASPSNGAFIRHLRIHPTPGGNNPDRSWIWLVPLRLFPMVSNLQRLDIMHVSLAYAHPSFIMAMSQFKTVTELSLRYLTFPSFEYFSRLVLALPSLRRLNLATVPVTRNDPPRLHAVKSHPRMGLLYLEEISVSADGRAQMDIAKWLLFTPSPTSLKKLIFDVLTDDFKYTKLVKLSLGRVLRACGPSVEEIELTINAEWIRRDGT